MGIVGFLTPFLGCSALARILLGWLTRSSLLAGVALWTTSMAVVYAVLLKLGFSRTSFGKGIPGARFINDLGTVIALALIFAPCGIRTLFFAGGSVAALVIAPHIFLSLFAGKSERALTIAMDVTRCGGGKLCLVSLIEMLPRNREERMNGVDEMVEQAQEHCWATQEVAAQKAARAGVTVSRQVLPGHSVEGIIHVADQEMGDRIVLGGMGHTRMLHRSSVGTGSQIAHHASCSVLLVR